MKILFFAGSLRKDSLNKKLALATMSLVSKDYETEFFDLKTLQLPVYDGDIESVGMPKGLQEFAQKIISADALVIVSPEYNGSISSPLKNTLDWLSRLKPQPFTQKAVLLMAASPGALGAVRGLLHSKVPLDALGCFVYPQNFGLAKAHEAFDAQGKILDGKTQERVQSLINDFLKYV